MHKMLDMWQATRYVLPDEWDLYHIEFDEIKHIDFALKQKYRIAKQYIEKSKLPVIFKNR